MLAKLLNVLETRLPGSGTSIVPVLFDRPTEAAVIASTADLIPVVLTLYYLFISIKQFKFLKFILQLKI